MAVQQLRGLSAVAAVSAVVAVDRAVALGALKRRPEPQRREVTYFSVQDIWLYEAIPDTKVCELCRRFEEHGDWHGNHVRANFPYLEILDRDTIAPNVHPNCRCLLHRLIEEPKEREAVTA